MNESDRCLDCGMIACVCGSMIMNEDYKDYDDCRRVVEPYSCYKETFTSERYILEFKFIEVELDVDFSQYLGTLADAVVLHMTLYDLGTCNSFYKDTEDFGFFEPEPISSIVTSITPGVKESRLTELGKTLVKEIDASVVTHNKSRYNRESGEFILIRDEHAAILLKEYSELSDRHFCTVR